MAEIKVRVFGYWIGDKFVFLTCADEINILGDILNVTRAGGEI